jgi:phosphomannomutase/phosphoglucomutase
MTVRRQIFTEVPNNSFEYFEKILITDNGFREYDVRWLLGKEINPNGFLLLGRAYGTFVQEHLHETRVVVGHDFRSYSQDLCRSFVVGLLSTGVHVVDIGLALTPMLYFAQHHLKARGGAIVTASHNENGWTGLKLADGLSSTLRPEGIQAFRRVVQGGSFADGSGTYETCDDLFADYLADATAGGPLRERLKVVVAAGNGTAGRFAPAVLSQLGCDVVELDCNGDWNFPRHNPNPEDISFLHGICKTVRETSSDVGIGIDGDGDRLGVVDDKGREIYSDKLGLLVARWLCPKAPGRTVVVDVKSTSLFFDDPVLRETNTKVVMWKTGHSYIKAKVAECNAVAGFEKAGHWFFGKPFGRGYDDAVLSAAYVLRFLSESGQTLSSLIDALPQTWQSPTLGVYCSDNVKYQIVEQVTGDYIRDRDRGTLIGKFPIRDIITVNGVRFVLEDGSWGLVRASSNKPSLVLVAESRTSRNQMYDVMEHIQSRLAETGQVGDYDQHMPPR